MPMTELDARLREIAKRNSTAVGVRNGPTINEASDKCIHAIGSEMICLKFFLPSRTRYALFFNNE